MYCNNCGKHNPEDSKFCKHCGEKIAEENVSETKATKEVTTPQPPTQKKKSWLTVTKVFIVLGIVFLLAGGDPAGQRVYASIGGTIFLLGALVYKARREQYKNNPSSKWIVFEVISFLIIGYVIWRGIVTGLWYDHPLSFTIIPPIVIFTWLTALIRKPQNKLK